MRHFRPLDDSTMERLFHRPPVPFTPQSGIDRLAMALGATLYTAATRQDLADSIVGQVRWGVTSMVLCLEDAVADDDVAAAEDNLVAALTTLHGTEDPRPLLFVRVRSPQQIVSLCRRLGAAMTMLTGFVLPKFGRDNGEDYLAALATAEHELAEHHPAGHELLCMPVLESAAIAYAEERPACLSWIADLLRANRHRVLAVRLGATDLSGLYGLRRPPDMTIYDIRVVAAMVADIVNHLGRADGGFVITGPVWEYFTARERIFIPRLRQTLFVDHDAVELRAKLLRRDLDGLIREVELDKANGIVGKTVIHPSHVPVVHALQVVTHEEYRDAVDILAAAAGGGVAASGYRNKMNESKPHLAWAHRTMARAEAFGVTRDKVAFVDVLVASLVASESW